MGQATNAFQFLISTLFDLYIYVVLLRFLMQATKANYFNPLAQFVVRATDPVLVPMRQFVPAWFGQDWAALLLALVLTLLKYLLIYVKCLFIFCISRVR